MSPSTYSFTNFCTQLSGTGNVVFPCTYSITRNNDEIDITIRLQNRSYVNYMIFYIGDYTPLLTNILQAQFSKLYKIVPDETCLVNLLKAVGFL